MNRCNILYVIQNSEFGGGERGFSQLIAGLDPRAFKIFVATTPRGRFYREIREVGASTFDIPFDRPKIPVAIRILKQIIKSEKIDIVHSQGARADFLARLAGRWAGIPAVVSTIQMPVEGFDVPWAVKLLYIIFDRISEKFVDGFIVVSESLRNHLITKHGVPEKAISLIYNGVGLNKYIPSRQENTKIRHRLGVPPHSPFVGAIGRLVWQKGFEFLIECIPEIERAFPNARILIVGDGPLREKLEGLGERLKVKKNLIFAGFRSDIKELLSAIDVLVIPSLLEGFPMITLEAMAMAKPIIATNIEGITEQITNGEDGILVPARDPAALADAIIKLLSDRKLAKKVGLAARKRVERDFSVEKMVSETEKVYLSFFDVAARNWNDVNT